MNEYLVVLAVLSAGLALALLTSRRQPGTPHRSAQPFVPLNGRKSRRDPSTLRQSLLAGLEADASGTPLSRIASLSAPPLRGGAPEGTPAAPETAVEAHLRRDAAPLRPEGQPDPAALLRNRIFSSSAPPLLLRGSERPMRQVGVFRLAAEAPPSDPPSPAPQLAEPELPQFVLRFDREGQSRPEHALADADLAAAGRVDEADARLEPETVEVIPLDDVLAPPGTAAPGPDPSLLPRRPSHKPDAAEAVPLEISPQDIFPPRSTARPDRLILGAAAAVAEPPGPVPTEIPETVLETTVIASQTAEAPLWRDFSAMPDETAVVEDFDPVHDVLVLPQQPMLAEYVSAGYLLTFEDGQSLLLAGLVETAPPPVWEVHPFEDEPAPAKAQ